MRWIAIAALVALIGCTAEPADTGGGGGKTAPKSGETKNGETKSGAPKADAPAAKGRLTLVYYNMPG